MSQNRTSLSSPLGILSMLLLFGCSQQQRVWPDASASGSSSEGSGGESGSNGSDGAAGMSLSSGGDSTEGGTSSNAGGSSSAGLTTGTGGASAAGGTTGSGGSSAEGGITGSGGSSAEGGTTGSGGSSAAGGTTGSGGSSAAGGTTGSGGSSAAGGTTGSGGSSAPCAASETVCASATVLGVCSAGAWVPQTCANGCTTVYGVAQCAACVPEAQACASYSESEGVFEWVITCAADGSGWTQTLRCYDMTPDCQLNSSTSEYECAALHPSDLENNFILQEQVPLHRFEQGGPAVMAVQQMLDVAGGWALA